MTSIFEFVFFVPLELVFPDESHRHPGEIQVVAKIEESESDTAFSFLFDDDDYEVNVEIVAVKMPAGTHLQDVDIDEDGWSEIESAAKQEAHEILHNNAFNSGPLTFH